MGKGWLDGQGMTGCSVVGRELYHIFRRHCYRLILGRSTGQNMMAKSFMSVSFIGRAKDGGGGTVLDAFRAGDPKRTRLRLAKRTQSVYTQQNCVRHWRLWMKRIGK